MVHKRLKMELIKKEKSRLLTFKKRKTNLLKKVSEFSILCGVDACIVIFEPEQNGARAKFETWPANPNELRSILNRYKKSDQPRRCYRVSDYFAEKKKRVDAEVEKLHKQIYQILYPPWHEDIASLSKDQLRVLVGQLDAKIEVANKRIEMLKQNKDLMKKGGLKVQVGSQLGHDIYYNMENNNIRSNLNSGHLIDLPVLTNAKPLDVQVPNYYYPEQSSFMSMLNPNLVERDFNNNVYSTSFQRYSDPRPVNDGLPVNFGSKQNSQNLYRNNDSMEGVMTMDTLNCQDRSNHQFGHGDKSSNSGTSRQCMSHDGMTNYVNPESSWMRNYGNTMMFNNANSYMNCYFASAAQPVMMLPQIQFPMPGLPYQIHGINGNMELEDERGRNLI